MAKDSNGLSDPYFKGEVRGLCRQERDLLPNTEPGVV